MVAEISRNSGAQFVVENRPGASGAIAVNAVRGSAPDGYTLLLGGSSVLLSAMLRQDGVDPFNGFVPVVQVNASPTALGVRADLGVRTIGDLVKLARERPGKVSFASPGIGSYAHFMMESIARKAGVQFLHVPYPQLGTAITDTVGGRLDAVFSTVAPMQSFSAEGKLVLVGVTGDKRSPVLPDVPTFAESGYPDLSVKAWNGLFAPAGTPAAVVDRLAAEFAKAGEALSVRELARTAVLEATVTPPDEFRELLARERAYWRRAIAETGIKAQ
jgi:tripartite-type tricarboxylate transporter receptor subunit TctC